MKPHIAKWNGRWVIWIARGRGVPHAVPENTFNSAAYGAYWLHQQQLQLQANNSIIITRRA